MGVVCVVVVVVSEGGGAREGGDGSMVGVGLGRGGRRGRRWGRGACRRRLRLHRRRRSCYGRCLRSSRSGLWVVGAVVGCFAVAVVGC